MTAPALDSISNYDLEGDGRLDIAVSPLSPVNFGGLVVSRGRLSDGTPVCVSPSMNAKSSRGSLITARYGFVLAQSQSLITSYAIKARK